MINKKNIWFLTLFSLILVLSVYYITMPSELLLTNISPKEQKTETVVKEEEGTVLEALRVAADEQLLEEIDNLKVVMADEKSTVDEKNEAFEKMKQLNVNKGEETTLEENIKSELKYKTFVKIKDDQIKVVVDNKEHNTEIANSIMRFVQSKYEKKKYITVEFK